MGKVGKLFRLDGWINILTGLGVPGVDKRTGTKAFWFRPVQRELEELYAASDLAAKIVDTLPAEALRQLVAFEGMDGDQETALWDEYRRLSVLPRVREAWSRGRLYGGSALLLLVDDGGLPFSEPLNLQRLRRLNGLVRFNRFELEPAQWDRDLASPTFGEPLTYRLSPSGAGGTVGLPEVHRSRLVIFPGAPLPDDLRQRNNSWDDSVLTRPAEMIRDLDASFASAAGALKDFRQIVVKMPGLSEKIAAGQEDEIRARLSAMQLAKSVFRAIVVDKEEEVETKETTFTGVDAMLEKFIARMVATTDMPRTKLFGESPTGMGGTGRHEETNWYDYVRAEQENYLDPRLMQINAVIFAQRQGPFAGRMPEGFATKYPPLWQPSEKEQADTRKVQADIDNVYWTMGALSADEVRQSRFGGPDYSYQTTIGETPDLEDVPEEDDGDGTDPATASDPATEQ